MNRFAGRLGTTGKSFLGGMLLLITLFAIWGCSSSDSSNGNIVTPTPSTKTGFGVSGLLFENNLVMWFRETDGNQSELFPQMYYTRADADNFPVWNNFPQDDVISGGVPRDGIPALVNPPFVSPGSNEADYLADDDLVLGVVINGEVKAYPHNILWWHEVANDVIGGENVIATLCPLTGTGMIFKTPADGNTARVLELLPVIETTWRNWLKLYPNTRVISKNTGVNRNYTQYPYNNYRVENTNPLFSLRTGNIDTRFLPKHNLLGLRVGDQQKAYPFSRLDGKPVVNDTFNGLDLVIVSDLPERLAIPYERRVDGQNLTFRVSSTQPFAMKDDQTQTTWNIKGEATSGPLAGSRLKQIPAHNAFWFAWAAFWPQTLVFGG